MTSLAADPSPARPGQQPAALPAAAARAARGDREPRARPRRRPAGRAPPRRPTSRSRASPCARRSTGWSRKGCWCAARARATSSRARIEKNFAKLTSFSEDMRARGRTPHSVWLQRAEGTVTPEEALTLRLSPGRAGLPLPPPALRRRRADVRSSTRPSSRACLPSLDAVGDSLYEALETRRQPPGARAAAAARAAAQRRAGEAARRARRRRRACWSSASASCATAARSSSASPTTAATPTTSSPSSARRVSEPRIADRARCMFREAAEARRRGARASSRATRARARGAGRALRARAPRAVVTCARGSSDHAATFAKYLIETRLGVLTASAAPSVSSVYGARQDLARLPVPRHLAVGPQPRPARDRARRAATPARSWSRWSTPRTRRWRELADDVLPLCAGRGAQRGGDQDRIIASLAALLHLVAAWTRGRRAAAQRSRGCRRSSRAAWELDWCAALRDAARGARTSS